jgi:hypothetical protein
MAFGISFTPTNQALADQGRVHGRTSLSGVGPQQRQEAVRFLSLRLPRFTGGGGIAPAPLLGAPGAMGQQGPGQFSFTAPGLQPSANAPAIRGAAHPLVQAVMRMSQMAPMLSPTSSAPPPRVTPGVQDPGDYVPGPETRPISDEPTPGPIYSAEEARARLAELQRPQRNPRFEDKYAHEAQHGSIPILSGGWSPYTGGGGFY